MIKSKISGVNKAKLAIKKVLQKLEAPTVLVGYHEDATDPKEGMTMASLAAVHEFGADIKHPGGTDYGYPTKEAASKGKVRFMAKGAGYMVLGQTKPHDIKIPARPSLVPGIDSGMEDYINVLKKGVKETVDKNKDLDKSLNAVGQLAVGNVQEYMVALKTPANAQSTIRRKGTNNPLIDNGLMKSSVTYKLSKTKTKEGL